VNQETQTDPAATQGLVGERRAEHNLKSLMWFCQRTWLPAKSMTASDLIASWSSNYNAVIYIDPIQTNSASNRINQLITIIPGEAGSKTLRCATPASRKLPVLKLQK
jgi:hypothetical protein